MIKLKFTLILVVFTALVSCGGSGDYEATSEGFSEMETEIKTKFGDDAYFTDLTVVNINPIGLTVNVTVTTDPESLKMEEWIRSQGNWEQAAEISLEIPEETKAADFMFQLRDGISLSKLGGLIEKSKKQLQEEKDLNNPKFSVAHVMFPDDGDISKAKYSINLEPENGGTTFSFYYTLDGELIEMNY